MATAMTTAASGVAAASNMMFLGTVVEAACAPAEALLLNLGERDASPVAVEPHLARRLRPHQREGVQFMYDCCLGRRRSADGRPLSGGILAHSMGLGKTLQALSLVHTLLKSGPRALEADHAFQLALESTRAPAVFRRMPRRSLYS